jgi:hypothetical protein
MRAAILGGGITGCVLAAELARSGRLDVTLLERGDRLGGLHRAVRAGPYVFDIGAFVFDDDHSIFSVFPQVQELFLRAPSRYGSIRDRGILDDYPCTMRGIRRQFGTFFLARILIEILVSKARRFRRGDLRSFVEYYMGPSLYRASGLQRYIARLYRAPVAEIDVEFAEKRLEAVADSGGIRRNLARLAGDLARKLAGEFARPHGRYVWVRPRAGSRPSTIGSRPAPRVRRLVARVGPRSHRETEDGSGCNWDPRNRVRSRVLDHPDQAWLVSWASMDHGPAYMDLYSCSMNTRGTVFPQRAPTSARTASGSA